MKDVIKQAQRAQSRPEGPHLEVGARRAPRLLVLHIFQNYSAQLTLVVLGPASFILHVMVDENCKIIDLSQNDMNINALTDVAKTGQIKRAKKCNQ